MYRGYIYLKVTFKLARSRKGTVHACRAYKPGFMQTTVGHNWVRIVDGLGVRGPSPPELSLPATHSALPTVASLQISSPVAPLYSTCGLSSHRCLTGLCYWENLLCFQKAAVLGLHDDFSNLLTFPSSCGKMLKIDDYMDF